MPWEQPPPPAELGLHHLKRHSVTVIPQANIKEELVFHPEILARGGKMMYEANQGGAMHCGVAQSAAIARGARGHAPPGKF